MNISKNLKYGLGTFLFCIICLYNLTAQDSNTQEKVILITDRTNYLPGDTIWFSSYVLNSKSHSLVSDENILHICFYNPNGELEQHILFPIKLGMCAGQIVVPELTKKGLYRIVAFTNYMYNWSDKIFCENQVWVNGDKTSLNVDIAYNWRNYKETVDTLLVQMKMRDTTDVDALFYSISTQLKSKDKVLEENNFLSIQNQSILAIPLIKSKVSDTMQLEVTVVDDQSIVTKQIVVTKDSLLPDVQFLPESGMFLSGQKQKVAFKAIDSYGRPIEFKGEVFDQNNNKLVEFTSIYDGMGYFFIEPIAGNNYHACVYFDNGVSSNYSLPAVISSGAIIGAKTKNDHVQINVQTQGVSRELKLLAHCRGSLVKIESIIEQTCDFTYDLNQFPVGLIHFTVVDTDNAPICERIIYNAPKTDVKVELPLSKKVYNKREEVRLPVSISGLTEKELAIYSVGVKDANFQHEYLEANVIAQTYLISELPGFIPNLKMLTNGTVKSNEMLDLVLLTSGWCRFSWKDVAERKSDASLYEKETAVTMKGQVRNIITNKPLKRRVVKGEFLGDNGNRLKSKTTNDNGDFRFEFPNLVEDLKGTISIYREGGYKPKRVFATVETTTNVYEIDLSLIDPVASNVSKAPFRKAIGDGGSFDILPKDKLTTHKKESIERVDNYVFGNSDTIMLHGVNVIETKIENVRQRFRDMFGTPLKVLTNKQVVAAVKEMPWYNNIWDLISATIPELYFERYPKENIYEGMTFKEVKELRKDELEALDNEYNYLYNAYIKGNKSRPVFFVLNGKRIHAHENPFLIPDDIEIGNQNQQFRYIDPQQITSIELYDNVNNVGGLESYYERHIIANLDIKNTSVALAKPYIISVNTKEGYNIWNTADPKNFNLVIKGLTEMRIPYTPKYIETKNDSSLYDQRKTLFWSPLQLTKNIQNQDFSFYTGDKEGEKLIQINGITTSGIPFFAESSFSVEKNDTIVTAYETEDISHKKDGGRPAINTSEGIVLKCIDANGIPVPYLVLKSEDNKIIATNKDGEVLVLKSYTDIYSVLSSNFKAESIDLTGIQDDTILFRLTTQKYEMSDYLKSAEKLVATAINNSWQRMLSKPSLSYFFREKVYMNDFLMGLEEWDLSCQLCAHGKYEKDNVVSFNKGKSYKVDDYFQKVKARPVEYGEFYPFSADPMFDRKPFLEKDQMSYYNYTLVGEGMQDSSLFYCVLFDVKADMYMPGYRGHILIDKNTTTISEVAYEISPINKKFLDGSYFVDDNPEELAIEVNKTSYSVKYAVKDEKFYPLLLHEKIEFTSKGVTAYCFEKEVLFNNELEGKRISRRLKSQTNMHVSLINHPHYDNNCFNDMMPLKLPQNDKKEIPFLHEIIEYR